MKKKIREIRYGRKHQWLFNLLRFVPDPIYNHLQFFYNYKRILNTKSPQRYSDILFAMKMSKPSQLQIQCADKVGVKNYCRSLGLADHIIDAIDVQKDHLNLKWNDYPVPFIVKISNASHLNVRVKSKDDIGWAIKQLHAFSRIDHSIYYREHCYDYSARNYIVEPWLTDLGRSLADYKVHCFEGIPKFIQINYPDTKDDLRVMVDFENNEVEYPFVSGRNADTIWDIRKYLPKLFEISVKLSDPFVFVRVDFFIVNGQVYVSEMTFYPSGGLVLRKSDRINREWGKLIHWKGRDLRHGTRFQK